MESAEKPRVISISEAGRRLGVSRGTAYEYARIGTIPTLRLSARRLVVPLAKFEKFLDGDTLDAPTPAVHKRTFKSEEVA